MGKGERILRHRFWLVLLVAGASLLLLVPSAFSDPDPRNAPKFGIASHSAEGATITNGTVKLGVLREGHLNFFDPDNPVSFSGTRVVGLRFLAGTDVDEDGIPDEYESTSPGCFCEGWGAGDAATEVTGFANEDEGGPHNLQLVSFEHDADSAVSTVNVLKDGNAVMRVSHDFHPSPDTPNVYEVTVTMENLTAEVLTDTRYRRVMDWDIEPTAFREFVTIIDSGSENLLFSSDDGFQTADPLGPRTSIRIVGPPDQPSFEDNGPADHGALFDFGFGELAAAGQDGDSVTFTILYGAAGTESDAVAAVVAAGAEVWSFGQPNVGDNGQGPTEGRPATHIFGFTGVGGAGIGGEDRRPPLALTVFSPDTVTPGEEFTATARIRNIGTGDATGVDADITLGEGITLVGGDDPANIGTIEPGQTVEQEWTLRAAGDCDSREANFTVTVDFNERPEGETPRSVSRTFEIVAACVRTTKSADEGTRSVGPGGRVGYTITVANEGESKTNVDSITDTLPAAFSYETGSTTGATTKNPHVSGQTLTWEGPFEIPGGGSISLHFFATASCGAGEYKNQAGVVPTSLGSGTGETAPVTVSLLEVDEVRVNDIAGDEGDEGTKSFDFMVCLSRPLDAPLTLIANTKDGTAKAGEDYQALEDYELVIEPGATSLPLAVQVIGDRAREGDETFGVELSLPEIGTLTKSVTEKKPADEETPPADDETPPAEETPPSDEEAPPADEETPPGDEETPPSEGEAPPSDEEAPPAEEETPPAEEETPPAEEETPPAEEKTPPAEEAPPADEGTKEKESEPAAEAKPKAAAEEAPVAATAEIGDGDGTATIQNDDEARSEPDPEPEPEPTTTPPATTAAPPPVPRPSLQVDVRVSREAALVGDPIVYTITVFNSGPGPASDVRVIHALPAAIAYRSATPSQGSCSGGQTTNCSLGAIPSGGGASVTVEGQAVAAGSATSSTSASAAGAPGSAGAPAKTILVTGPPQGQAGSSVEDEVPNAGETVIIEPVAGDPLIRLPGTSLFVPLSQVREIPIGSVVRLGPGDRVEITSAAGTIILFAGPPGTVDFVVSEVPVGSARTVSAATADFITQFTLVGGNFAKCRVVTTAKAKPKPKKKRGLALAFGESKTPVRSLWGNGKGRFRTKARYSAATVRGTNWLTSDRCDGTLTSVREGVVEVLDNVRNRRITLRAGQSYLAKAPARQTTATKKKTTKPKPRATR